MPAIAGMAGSKKTWTAVFGGSTCVRGVTEAALAGGSASGVEALGNMIAEAKSIVPFTGAGTVSYTHLDVYKRQAGSCPARGARSRTRRAGRGSGR